MRKILSIALAIILISILLIGVSELPMYGNENNPANNYVASKYLENSIEETGALNIVTGIILDYRAFDTFGEATVLFTSIIVVILCLRRASNK